MRFQAARVCVCFLVGDFFISLGKGGTNSASGKKTARFRTGVCNTICMLFVTSYVQTRLKQKAFQGGGKMNIHTFSKNEPGSGHHEQPGFWHDRGFSHNQYFITCDLQNKSLLHCFWVFAGLAFCTGNKVFVAGALPVVIGGTSYLAIECQTGLSFHDPPISKILHIYIYIFYILFSCVPGNGSLWQKSFFFGGLDIAIGSWSLPGWNAMVAAVRLQNCTGFSRAKMWTCRPILHHYALYRHNHILLYSYIYNLRFQGDSEVFNPKVTSFQDWNLNSPGFVASSKPRHITAKRGYQILHSHGPQVSTKTWCVKNKENQPLLDK